MVFVSLNHPSFTRLVCCWAVTHLTRRPCRPDFGVATEVSKSYSRRRLQLSVERVCSTTQRLRAVEDNASAALLRCRQRHGCQISLERENQASWESFGSPTADVSQMANSSFGSNFPVLKICIPPARSDWLGPAGAVEYLRRELSGCCGSL